MTVEVREKPVEVTRAVAFLWASLALGFVKLLLDQEEISAVASPIFVNSILLTITALFAFLVFKISSGRNWARFVYLVPTLLGLPISIPIMLNEFSRAPILGFMSIIQVGLQLIAMWLIFTSPGKNWFRRSST